MQVGEYLAKWCEAIEAPFVAGIPGSGVTELIDALGQHTDVPFALTRHEQSAAMMAYSYGFQTRRPAVVAGTKAPGATNLAIGVMGAWVESLPMIVLSAQVASKHIGLEAFEEIDLVRFFDPITKWSVQINSPARLASTLDEAYRLTVGGRPGPVHLCLPYDLMSQEIDETEVRLTPLAEPASDSGIDEAAEMLRAARRPLIVVGGGMPFGADQALMTLAREHRIPVVSAWLRKPVDDLDPYFVGMCGIGGGPASCAAVAEADVVLAMGTRFSEQMTEHYKMRFADDAALIHVDIDPGVLGRVFPTRLGVTADVGSWFPRLVARLGEPDAAATGARDGAWLERVQALRAGELRRRRDAVSTADPLDGRTVVSTLRALTPPDTHVVLDSGNYLHWADEYFHVTRAGQFHYPTSGTMGFGVPGAIGAKIAHPDRLVCALVGDGGFAMTMSEVETAKRLGVGILVVVVNNSTLGHIRMRQVELYDGRVDGVDFGFQDFGRLGPVYDVFSATVTTVAELEPVLTEAIGHVSEGRVAIVDCHVSDLLARGPLDTWWQPGGDA